MKAASILIIDDEVNFRQLLARVMQLEGYEALEAGDGKSALEKLRQQEAEVILCDVKLPDLNGIELISRIKSLHPFSEIIILTAYGNISDGVKSIQAGAFDYITKGDDNNKIIPLVQRALEKIHLRNRVLSLEKQVGRKYSFENIIGKSGKILEAVSLARKVAHTDTAVLLLGETGTGKEVFAQAIHTGSERSGKPFVAINCSAISRDLLENELFGHKAGAFTGALKETKGLLEEANHGTLFLDEIGEMPQDLQAKFLRVLETGEFLKVGASKTSLVNVRIIAATHRDLKKEIEDGHFRADLFYRLSVFQIHLPPLRERMDDLGLLAQNFADKFAVKVNKRNIEISDGYLAKLRKHNWPGNLRELKNIVERSLILSETATLGPELLPADFGVNSTGSTETHSQKLSEVEKNHILKILTESGGNKTRTAEILGIGLTTLYRKLEEYGIEK